MSAAICVVIEVETSCRLMEMDCRFCNTLPNRSDSVFAVSPKMCIRDSNEDLEAAVSEKRFRQDLLYRLRDFEITVPPSVSYTHLDVYKRQV